MADYSELLPYVDLLKTARVLCIGDVMLDHYVYGQVERVSPEAPIPVLWIEREMKTLGGAGNVLRNLRALSDVFHGDGVTPLKAEELPSARVLALNETQRNETT